MPLSIDDYGTEDKPEHEDGSTRSSCEQGLALGTTAEAGVYARHGALSLVSSGALRIIAAIMQGGVIRKILRPLKLAVDPPPIAPACVRQEAFAWSSA